jgi:CubicO group peptidase (beta-lactamase class C family)
MLPRVAIVLALFGCKERKEVPKPAKPAVVAAADAAVKQTLDQELEEIRAEAKLPALAAAVWHDGKLVEIAAVGVRKIGDNTKVTTKDLGTSARTARR